MSEPPARHAAADRDWPVRRLETRTATPRRSTAAHRRTTPQKRASAAALPRQVTIERWAQNGVRFDTVVKPIDEPGDSLPTTERLECSCWRKQRRGVCSECAAVIDWSATGVKLTPFFACPLCSRRPVFTAEISPNLNFSLFSKLPNAVNPCIAAFWKCGEYYGLRAKLFSAVAVRSSCEHDVVKTVTDCPFCGY